mgnify:CR=1 FL=1
MPESSRDEIAKLEALYANNPEGRVFTHLAEAYRKAGELDRARAILEDGLFVDPLGRTCSQRQESDDEESGAHGASMAVRWLAPR